MRCWRSSAWTMISPMASSRSTARSLDRRARRRQPGEPGAAARAVADAEALAGGDAGHPRDLASREDHGRACAALARDLAVREEVLQRAAAAEAERAHPVAGAPGADLELGRERVAVERAVGDRE